MDWSVVERSTCQFPGFGLAAAEVYNVWWLAICAISVVEDFVSQLSFHALN